MIPTLMTIFVIVISIVILGMTARLFLNTRKLYPLKNVNDTKPKGFLLDTQDSEEDFLRKKLSEFNP